MSWIDDEGTMGCCFVWTIQNFSYCFHKPGYYLDSPSFILEDGSIDRWLLRLYPRGTQEIASADPKTIAFRLCIEQYPLIPRTAEFALSIRTSSGLFKKLGDLNYTSENYTTWGYTVFMKHEELRRKMDTFLNNDTMTLRCRIWKLNGKFLSTEQCYMRTIVNVEKTTNIWSLEKFRLTASDELTTELSISLYMKSLISVKLLTYRKSFFGDNIKLEIKQVDKTKPCLFTCDFSLVEACGKVFHFTRGEYRFDKSDVLQVWTFPYFPPSKIVDFENTYLNCVLAVSSGIEYTWVEGLRVGEIDILNPARTNLEKELCFADSWKDDLKRFYSNGTFSDVTVRTQSKEFPVHKVILCARSTVFQAMFERDMKGNVTGVVDIEDVDADTISKMLLFAYSDVAEDLDCEAANKLYSAADKYRITALRRRCSDFLKKNLSVSNVCEVFVLANEHRDEDLKSFVQDFIAEHAAEVMRSVEWKRFMQYHVQLHSETMHALFLRNI